MDEYVEYIRHLDAPVPQLAGLPGKAKFECVESSFAFNRWLPQGSVEAPRLWRKMATQVLANVDEERVKQRKGVLMDFETEGRREHQNLQFFKWADNFWIISLSKKHLQQMLEDLIGEAAEVKLVVDEHIRF